MTHWIALLFLLPLGAGHAPGLRFERPAPEELAALREHVDAIRGARPGVELVPHGKRIAVVASLGEKPTGGYAVSITRLSLRASKLTVTVRVTEPPKDAIVTQALTYPFDAVWIPAARLANLHGPLKTQLLDQNGKRLAEGSSRPSR